MVEGEFFKIPTDWEYRGEGNCHVVLGLPEMKKVLRIRKRDKPRNLLQWIIFFITDYISWWYSGGALSEVRDLNFHLKIMRPLLGYQYVSEAVQVNLCRNQVKKIEYQLSKVRPDFRKPRILHFGRATLFHDYTTLDTSYLPFKFADDTFSIEIKPKKGWIPLSETSYPECIYCMNQYLKLETKKISERSEYCPKYLFSGSEMDIMKSILSLIDNPQNNFRIFTNGQLSYDENKNKKEMEMILEQIFHINSVQKEELLKEFSLLLFKCLTTDFEIQSSNCEAKVFCKRNENIHANSLPKGCILEKILYVQMLNIEGTEYYSKPVNRFSEWGYVNSLLSTLDTRKCVKCSLLAMSNAVDFGEKDLFFAPYLVAAVANDCSLMITLRKIQDNQSNVVDRKEIIKSKFGSFLVNVGVFDLYPKPMSTIKKHEIRNKKLLELYETVKKKI